jgi:hypothetical protein
MNGPSGSPEPDAPARDIPCSHVGLISFLLLILLVAPARADETPQTPVTVPFELLPTRHMAVQIKLNGKGPYRMIFDTGSPVVLLNNKVARDSGVLDKNAIPPAFALFGTVGQQLIQTLELGKLKADKVPAVILDHPTLEAAAKVLGPVEGIIGFPLFARYRMTLDYQARKMTFVPNGYQPPDVMQGLAAALLERNQPAEKIVLTPAAQWGFIVHKEAGDTAAGVTVQQVLPGSAAAAAGLKLGDRLLTLDGRWTDTVTDCYTAAEHVRPGTAANVRIRRDGRERELTITPRAGL